LGEDLEEFMNRLPCREHVAWSCGEWLESLKTKENKLQHARHETAGKSAGLFEFVFIFNEKSMEATPGIEPGYADLQSAASPLRHVAS
jgi:hypothetical protein